MKNIISKIGLLSLIVFTSVLSACEDDTSIAPSETGSLEIDFDARVDGVGFDTSSVYTNVNGETVRISMFNYFVSNIKLKKADGSIYTHPQDSSYFLIKSPNKETIKLNNVPAADYTELTFTIGVDSARSVADVSKRGGILDIASANGASGMYWGWNAGYIFVKMEGFSPSLAKPFYRHIGLYGGVAEAGKPKTLNNLQNKTLTFGSSKAMVRKNITPEIHLLVNPLEIFGADSISITKNAMIMNNNTSKGVAQKYPDMFVFDHVHNN